MSPWPNPTGAGTDNFKSPPCGAFEITDPEGLRSQIVSLPPSRPSALALRHTPPLGGVPSRRSRQPIRVISW
jgi:hypothetical protein